MDVDPSWALLGLAALLAGMVDAIVGGGGLIQIPALLSAYPAESPARLFGTNKVASIVGTSSAAIQYSRRISVPWALALPGATAAALSAWCGANFVSAINPSVLKPLVILLLLLAAAYTFHHKDFGLISPLKTDAALSPAPSVFIGMVVGFYDGFFGPGTGSFFIFLLIRFAGLDFLRASASAKIFNVATNLGALSFFGSTQAVMWPIGVLMAVCNLTGAQIGSHLAIRGGARLVRKIFLAVVLILVGKLTVELYRQ